MEQLHRVWADSLHIPFSAELLIAQLYAAVVLYGREDGVEEFKSGRYILKHHAFLHYGAVGQHSVDGERREEPALDVVIAQHIGIVDEVLVCLFLALYDDAEHTAYGIAVAVERRTRQGIALGNHVFLPFLVQFLEGKTTIRPERIDDPNNMIEFPC